MFKKFKRNENLPQTSKEIGISLDGDDPAPTESWRIRFCRHLYDRDKKLFCGRTWKSWLRIVAYSIMYLVFLCTYTMIFLYCSLLMITNVSDFDLSYKIELYTYSEKGIGLSATPTGLNNQPLIWYSNEQENYQKYVDSIENMFGRRRKRDTNEVLGPCSKPPYGFGTSPCIIVRINKQMMWSAKPLSLNSSNPAIPDEVKSWMKLDKQKLWLSCSGYHNYDKEHVKTIKYYPHPPGFDPESFPMRMKNDTPLIAVQISDFTFGVSLAIQCSLWYEGGVSTTEFMLYVTDKKMNNNLKI